MTPKNKISVLLSVPEMAFSRHFTMLQSAVIVGSVVWITCFDGLNSFGLFDKDEGLYATAARQMLESGDWLTPRVGTAPFFDKPPLTYWLQATSIALLGATPGAVRLPSALAAMLTALVVWLWARRTGNEAAGRWAALIYLACPLTVGLARLAIMDSLLTLWLTLAAFGWIEGYREKRRREKRHFYLLMAAAMGLAAMTKGVIGLLLPGMALALWLILRRDRAEWRQIPWAAGTALFLCLTLPWHLAVWHANPGVFWQEYIVHNHIERFLGRDFSHNAPLWYYTPVLLLGLFPWSALAPRAWRDSARGWKFQRDDPACAQAMWAIWAVVVTVFFSLSRSKLPGYVLPALPALAILIAVQSSGRDASLRAWETALLSGTTALIGGVLGAVGVLGLFWLAGSSLWLSGGVMRPEIVRATAILAPFTLAAGVAVLLGGFALVAQRTSARRMTRVALCLSLTIALLTTWVGLPRWSAYDIEPLQRLAEQTRPALARGAPLVLYHIQPRRSSLRFALEHSAQITETDSPSTLQAVLRAGNGEIIAPASATLPPLSVTMKCQSRTQSWILYVPSYSNHSLRAVR